MSSFGTDDGIGDIIRGGGRIEIEKLKLNLNCDLFVKNVADSPLRRCGSIENAQHFFFHCTFYQAQRNELINAIFPYQQPVSVRRFVIIARN